MTSAALPADFAWARLVPELIVSDLGKSLIFWRNLLGFRVAYERLEDRFAYLDLSGAQVMLAEQTSMGRWINAELARPFGRGVNLQIEVPDLDGPIVRLRSANWPLYLPLEEKWYRAGHLDVGVSQFVVEDPDGYLVRLSSPLGQRPTLSGLEAFR